MWFHKFSRVLDHPSGINHQKAHFSPIFHNFCIKIFQNMEKEDFNQLFGVGSTQSLVEICNKWNSFKMLYFFSLDVKHWNCALTPSQKMLQRTSTTFSQFNVRRLNLTKFGLAVIVTTFCALKLIIISDIDEWAQETPRDVSQYILPKMSTLL